SGGTVEPLIEGVPIGRRSPPQRGPLSMPIHIYVDRPPTGVEAPYRPPRQSQDRFPTTPDGAVSATISATRSQSGAGSRSALNHPASAASERARTSPVAEVMRTGTNK